MKQSYKERIAYFEKHNMYFESDGDIGARTHYLAGLGISSPRFSTFHDLQKITLYLVEFDIEPTFDKICRVADSLNIYSF